MLKKWPAWYVLLFATFPILNLLQVNIDKGPQLGDIWVAALACQVIAFLSLLLCRAVIRDEEKSNIASYGVLVLFFSYEHIVRIVLENKIISFILVRKIFVNPWSWFFLMVILVLSLRRTKRGVPFISTFIKITTVILILFSLVKVVKYYIFTDFSEINRSLIIEKLNVPVPLDYKPDIYFIVADEYAGAKQLKYIYNYDTSDFNRWLYEKGLRVLDERKTSSLSTIESLSSTLNMRDMREVPARYEMLRANKVAKYLKSKGYKIINAGLGLFFTSFNKYVDVTIEGNPYKNYFNEEIIRGTLLKPIFDSHYVWNATRRQPVLYQIAKIKEIAKENGPKFVFVHLPIPHANFVFTKDGEEPKVFQGSWSDRSLYLDQYIFTTNKLKELVTDILKRSPKPPIIIIQSDHGVRKHDGIKNIDYNDQYRIFCAYYLPDQRYDLLSEHTSLKDTFQELFRHYFAEEVSQNK